MNVHIYKRTKSSYRLHHTVCDQAIRYLDNTPVLCRNIDRPLWEYLESKEREAVNDETGDPVIEPGDPVL